MNRGFLAVDSVIIERKGWQKGQSFWPERPPSQEGEVLVEWVLWVWVGLCVPCMLCALYAVGQCRQTWVEERECEREMEPIGLQVGIEVGSPHSSSVSSYTCGY